MCAGRNHYPLPDPLSPLPVKSAEHYLGPRSLPKTKPQLHGWTSQEHLGFLPRSHQLAPSSGLHIAETDRDPLCSRCPNAEMMVLQAAPHSVLSQEFISEHFSRGFLHKFHLSAKWVPVAILLPPQSFTTALTFDARLIINSFVHWRN